MSSSKIVSDDYRGIDFKIHHDYYGEKKCTIILNYYPLEYDRANALTPAPKSSMASKPTSTNPARRLLEHNSLVAVKFPRLSDCKSYAVSCTGGIVGAVLGGTVFGSVMTMIVFLCFFRAFRFLKIRNSDCKRRSYENLQESLPPVVTDSVYNEINDQAVIRIQPMRRPESAHVSPREETYSHLHESNKEDMNESYDNARPVPSACVREDGYKVLPRVGNNNREVQTTATDDVPSEIQNDNYFIIEPQ
uniref:Uncharacterized protein n=1 Tax=Magallana gigas TaxID=29159 RepID=A0A8W8LYD5_MAGGI